MNLSHAALTRGAEEEREGHVAATQSVRAGEKGAGQVACVGHTSLAALILFFFHHFQNNS